jgi:hypothetical protein
LKPRCAAILRKIAWLRQCIVHGMIRAMRTLEIKFDDCAAMEIRC